MQNDPFNISGGQFVQPAEPFTPQTRKPLVKFLSRGVQPPSQVYVENEDDIVVAVASSAANEQVTFSYRLLRFDGELVEGQFIVRPAADRSIKVYAESLAEGFLLSVSCKAAAATTRGQTFARAFLNSPAFSPGNPSYMLMADYVTTAMAPAHPNGRVISPVEGPGRVYVVNNPNPGLGADWLLAMPTNARWRVLGIQAQFAAGAGGAGRQVRIEMFVGANPFFFGAGTFAQPAASSWQYSFAPGVPFTTDAVSAIINPLPDSVTLPPGGVIQSLTQGIQATDQWSSQNFCVEEWLDNV